MDDTLAASFPASDPPAWNPGLAHPGYVENAREPGEVRPPVAHDRRPYRSGRTFLQSLVSLAGAAGIVLLIPVAILLVGLPVALAIRGVLELVLFFVPGLR